MKDSTRPILPLHRGWKFFEPGSGRWLGAQVPGCVHTDLLRHKLIPDPFHGNNELSLQWIGERNWKYATTFTVPRELWQHQNIELVADGLDTLARVFLNGRLIAATENMFTGYCWPVKKKLRAGRNELRIEFARVAPYLEQHLKKDHMPEWNDPVGGCSVIRKEQCQFGWDWGPRFITSGIYRGIRLEAWSGNRIDSIRIEQRHARGEVVLKIFPGLAVKQGKACFHLRLSHHGETVAEGDSLELKVRRPQLWWPNGLGAQPLYDLEVEWLGKDGAVDKVTRRIGLRTIELDRHRDQWGEAFQFKVNGVPVFAKGANWIPAHSFVTEVTREIYDNLLTSAADAHMNMLRIWGGGIYESEDFYDLCDEKGLLIWQDFMFACALYPGDAHFLSLVRQEAEYQVKRLAHRACLALWCGNNEIEQMPQEIVKTKARKKAYDSLFYKVLPAAVEKFDGTTSYWPSSPHNPKGYEKGFNSERAGDAHFWDVWHARFPVKSYETKNFRFCSEFGMQSYSSPEVAATFCPSSEMNVFGPTMENHQKNSAGNQIIIDYISRRYRFPKDYAALAYLSQLNQAYCMKIGVEHFRRYMPRTMGALYWQLNDCWPVFSWSSLEFGGNWKALHYEARRFFAPVLVSAQLPGDEVSGKINRFTNTIHEVNIHTVSDERETREGTLHWTLYHFKKGILRHARKSVKLQPGKSTRQMCVDFKREIAGHGAAQLVLRLWLEIDGVMVSQNTVFFTAPRFMDLPRAGIRTAVRRIDDRRFDVQFKSDLYQHAVFFHLPKVAYRASDNFFDLFPNVPHRVTISTKQKIQPETLVRALRKTVSLVDSFA